MEQNKRVCVRIGDIFCVEIEGKYKRFFQYVVRDETQLQGQVIRVFDTKYKIDEDVDFEKVVNDKVYFYAHLYIRQGIELNQWYKCGKSKNIGNMEDIKFRLCSEGHIHNLTCSHRWYVWEVNKERKQIGNLTGEYKKYSLGPVFASIFVYNKIVSGKYGIKLEELQ